MLCVFYTIQTYISIFFCSDTRTRWEKLYQTILQSNVFMTCGQSLFQLNSLNLPIRISHENRTRSNGETQPNNQPAGLIFFTVLGIKKWQRFSTSYLLYCTKTRRKYQRVLPLSQQKEALTKKHALMAQVRIKNKMARFSLAARKYFNDCGCKYSLNGVKSEKKKGCYDKKGKEKRFYFQDRIFLSEFMQSQLPQKVHQP